MTIDESAGLKYITGVTEPILKEDYILAQCCSPGLNDTISGYYSYGGKIKVHRSNCESLDKSESDRFLSLEWSEITADKAFIPEQDYDQLDRTDFAVLAHHREYDIDYSLMVAKMLSIPRKEAFERHRKLRELKLIERVDAVMVRYRKNTVVNKWIKHRNHTYFRLTRKGSDYLSFYQHSHEN